MTLSKNLSTPSSSTDLSLVNLLDVVEDETDSQMLAAPDDPESELCRMLSVGSFTPDGASSSAEPRVDDPLEEYRKIGAGACGVVFSLVGTPLAFKVAKAGYHADLWNDANMHTTIREAFNRFSRRDAQAFKIPQFYGYVPAEEAGFFSKHPNLVRAAAEECQTPSHVLLSERIWPLPLPIRQQLIGKYCHPRIQEIAHSDPANKDCLVRLYLGSLRGRVNGNFFSLRNFKLHLNQMVDLGLDVEVIAHKMGSALAIMHWAARTDGRDVEFVLGSSVKKTIAPQPLPSEDGHKQPCHYVGPPTFALEDFQTRTTELWILDFNQVQRISLDDAGVAQAVNAVKINDPYFPRPHGKSVVERRNNKRERVCG
ncbi:hypothetical protein CP532_6008 [Ophiocordyceps camponoti-leonardi (nom. inval.)]|nr:hypothetical protein CP532_6008 [Ophiocordyceps camponoti-leonardi (nom. inval.)]